MSTQFKFKITGVFKQLKELNNARTETIHMEVHKQMVDDLISDPDLESYVGSRGVTSIETLERLFGCRIFTHNDNDRFDIINFTYRTEVKIH